MKFWVNLLIMCCLTLPCISVAKDCKIKENKEGYLATGNYRFGQSMVTALNIGFLLDEDGPLLQATYNRQFKNAEITVDAETPLTLQFESGQTMALEPVGEDRAKRTFVGFLWSNKRMYSTYSLSHDGLDQIASEALTGATISIKLGGKLTESEYKVKKEKWAKKIKELANCMIPLAEPTRKSTE